MKNNYNKAWFLQNCKANQWWHLSLLILLPLIIYFQSVKFDYTNFDDNGIIQQKFALVGDIHKIDTAFKVDAFFNPHGDFYRPVQNISFMLDAQVSRDKLWMFHITNLLIHILTGISLYFFLQFIDLKRYTAFLLSTLFVVHPLFASCVGWIPSRGDILIGLLGIQLFLSFGNYFKTGKLIYLVIHILLFAITLFTKETTVIFPLIFLYYYFLILHKKFSLKNIISLIPFFLAWASIFLVFFVMRKHVVAASGATVDVLGIIPFFKNNPVIPTLIGKFFLPVDLSTLPLYTNKATIIGIIFLLLTLYLTFDSSKGKKILALLGLIWFMIFAIPPTIYRLENADVFFNYLEHRTYLPMIGIVIILGCFIDQSIDAPLFARKTPWIFIPLVILFSIMAWLHCSDYKNNFSLAMRAASQNNPSGFSMRAGNYMDNKDTTNAMIDMDKAIELSPKDPNMYFARGNILARLQRHAEAEQDYSMTLSLNGGFVPAYLARSVERRIQKKYESAFRDIYTAATYDSANPKVYFSFGNLFMAVNNYSNADSSYSKAIQLQPLYAEAYNNRAYTRLFLKNYTGAINDCYKALDLMNTKPSPVTFNNLGKAYCEKNQLDSALKYFNKAIELNQYFSEAYFERGVAKQKNNDKEGACKDWKTASAFGYKDSTYSLDKFCSQQFQK